MLRAALEVIAERGYPDTRITDVAERAGTSPALVIYYFKTRDQLLTEAMRFSEDAWYAAGARRMAAIETAAGRLEEIVAMTCLPDDDDGAGTPGCSGWICGRSPPVTPGSPPSGRSSTSAGGRRSASLVRAGQEAGEFRTVDAGDFAVTLSALLDGLAIQIALEDPVVDAGRAFELSMRFAAAQLGFDWEACGGAAMGVTEPHESAPRA